MKTCETCGAKILEDTVVLKNALWSKMKAYNRFCKYAIERNKPCLNNCRIADNTLTWEHQNNILNKDMQRLL